MNPQTLTYDAEEAALTVNTFSRAGYNFLGWAESPTSTHGEYADGQTVRNLTPMSGGVITLYAVWKANTVQVVFDGNGADTGSMAKSFAQTQNWGTWTQSFAAPTGHDGSDFHGTARRS